MWQRARWWVLGAIAWTVLALLSASQWAVSLAADGKPIHWAPLVTNRLVDWYSCAIFTPLFFWLARRYPIDRQRWAPHVALHLSAAVALTPAKFAIQRWVMADLLVQPFPPLTQMLAHAFISETIAFW